MRGLVLIVAQAGIVAVRVVTEVEGTAPASSQVGAAAPVDGTGVEMFGRQAVVAAWRVDIGVGWVLRSAEAERVCSVIGEPF